MASCEWRALWVWRVESCCSCRIARTLIIARPSEHVINAETINESSPREGTNSGARFHVDTAQSSDVDVAGSASTRCELSMTQLDGQVFHLLPYHSARAR